MEQMFNNKKEMKMLQKEKIDRAIFEFDSAEYSLEDVRKFSRQMCERLSNQDEYNVAKYNIDNAKTIETLLNNDAFDTTNCWYRVFI